MEKMNEMENHDNVKVSGKDVNGLIERVGYRFPFMENEHDLKARKMGDKYVVEILSDTVVKAYAINVYDLRKINAMIDGRAYWVIKESGKYLGVIYSRVYDINVRWFTCFDVNIIDGVFREIEIPPFGIVRKALINCKDAI
jgi:hypothetical protein